MSKVLPVGYHTPIKPNHQNKCDLTQCLVENDEEPWSILEGCAHSFHHACLQGLNHCPICVEFLREQINNLGSVAKDAILGNANTHSKSQSAVNIAEDIENEDDETEDVEAEDEANSNKIPQTPSISDRSKCLQAKIAALKPASPLMSKQKTPAVKTPIKTQDANVGTNHVQRSRVLMMQERIITSCHKKQQHNHQIHYSQFLLHAMTMQE